MKQGIRFIIGPLVLAHVLSFGAAASCQTTHGSTTSSHPSPPHQHGTHSPYCAWSCQATASSPTVTPATPEINPPIWQDYGRWALTAHKFSHLTLRFLPLRAPPA